MYPNSNFYLINTYIPYILLGPPTQDFCAGKPNGRFGNSGNSRQFFYCVGEQATACQFCSDGTTYSDECKDCVRPGTGKNNCFDLLNVFILYIIAFVSLCDVCVCKCVISKSLKSAMKIIDPFVERE